MHKVAIVGAGGYSGAELVSILLRHPHASIVGVFASARRDKQGEPEPFGDVFPRFRGQLDLALKPYSADDLVASGANVAFLATPHEASLEIAPELLERGVVVLDLSAALRLKDASQYPPYYGFEHHRPDLLAQAVYGLPELHRHELRGARLVAVPGCYPTSAILPLHPLVKAGAIRAGTRPIIDSTSGVSGAGRSLSLRSLFCEVSQSPYAVLTHRHTPEISAYAGLPVVFTPHLGPYDRGILSTIHVELAPDWTGERVRATLAAAYANEPFVRVLPKGSWPSVAGVDRTNFCDIALAVDEPHAHLVICSAIDNLVKGAAGQAVQAMNAALTLPETDGLL
ncbi:MAG: N-acetyl-gamma-glutamyl-phosphate reductase [Planctomycetota bacterium]|nr:N-acetyl-gamma-glutamyl-phosphate reductase [Planctomycetota bacterium]